MNFFGIKTLVYDSFTSNETLTVIARETENLGRGFT